MQRQDQYNYNTLETKTKTETVTLKIKTEPPCCQQCSTEPARMWKRQYGYYSLSMKIP